MRPLKDDEIIEPGDLIDNGFDDGWVHSEGVGRTPAYFGNEGKNYRRPIKKVKEKNDSAGCRMTYADGVVTFWSRGRFKLAHIKPGFGGLELTVEPKHFLEPCVVAEGLAFLKECEREALTTCVCPTHYSFEASEDPDEVRVRAGKPDHMNTLGYMQKDCYERHFLPEPVIAAARKFMGWT